MVQASQRLRHDEHPDPRRDELDGEPRGGGLLDRAATGDGSGPGEDVVGGLEQHLVVELGEGHVLGLLERGEQVVLRHDDDRRLVVQRDGVQAVAVDGQAQERGVDGARAQEVGRFRRGDGDQVEGTVGAPLRPGPGPLPRGRAGDVAEPERPGRVGVVGHRRVVGLRAVVRASRHVVRLHPTRLSAPDRPGLGTLAP